jgi:hypothetical protein
LPCGQVAGLEKEVDRPGPIEIR